MLQKVIVANISPNIVIRLKCYTEAFLDKDAARKLVARVTGRSWRRQFLASALRVGGKQVGRVFGIEPRHPLAAAPLLRA